MFEINLEEKLLSQKRLDKGTQELLVLNEAQKILAESDKEDIEILRKTILPHHFFKRE